MENERKILGRGVILVAGKIGLAGRVCTMESLQKLMETDPLVSSRNPELTETGELIIDFLEEDIVDEDDF